MSLIVELQLAKPVMENEEGLNHLWIRWHGVESSAWLLSESPHQALLSVHLPEGIHRSVNLNGYTEDMNQVMTIDLICDSDVLFELYTDSFVQCGEITITAIMAIGEQRVEAAISVQLVNADEVEEVAVNEQVVERVKQLSMIEQLQHTSESDGTFVSIPPRWLDRRPNEYDYLVERYRIDCGIASCSLWSPT